MHLERLKAAKQRTVGFKQTQKAIEKGTAKVVYVAVDAEQHVTMPLLKLCSEKAIVVVNVPTMDELGRACRIEVGSAVAAIVEE